MRSRDLSPDSACVAVNRDSTGAALPARPQRMATFASISLCGAGSNDGRAAVGDAVVWTARAGDKTVTVPLTPAVKAAWYDVGRSYQLWLAEAGGALTRLDGFRLGDFDKLRATLGDRGVTLTKRELSAKGRNWGSARVSGEPGGVRGWSGSGAAAAGVGAGACGARPAAPTATAPVQHVVRRGAAGTGRDRGLGSMPAAPLRVLAAP